MSETLLATDLDRRRSERVEAEYRVRFGSAEGVTRDISAGGLYFVTESVVTVGQRLRIAMTISDVPGGTVTVRARVCRVDELEDATFGVAVILEGFAAGSARGLRPVAAGDRTSTARAAYARHRLD